MDISAEIDRQIIWNLEEKSRGSYTKNQDDVNSDDSTLQRISFASEDRISIFVIVRRVTNLSNIYTTNNI